MSMKTADAPVGATEIAELCSIGRATVERWQQRHPDFPPTRWTVAGRPAWSWREDIVPWLIATGRAKHLPPTDSHLLAYQAPHGRVGLMPVSPRHADDPGVISGADLPTLTAAQADQLLAAAEQASQQRSRAAAKRNRRTHPPAPATTKRGPEPYWRRETDPDTGATTVWFRDLDDAGQDRWVRHSTERWVYNADSNDYELQTIPVLVNTRSEQQ